MAEMLEGRCSCGAVRYRMTSRPMIVHACHCTECQRLSGSAFAVNALIEADRVEILVGTAEPAPVTGRSGKAQTVFRCPTCPVALWSNYPGAGEAVKFVRVGTMVEPSRLPPDIHIFTSTRLAWLKLPPHVPAVPEYYRAEEIWPPESLARRAALRKA